MRSLRVRLGVVWGLLAMVCAAMLATLWLADRSGPKATLSAAQDSTAAACAAIQDSVARLVGSSAKGDAMLLNVVTDLSLRDLQDIEGGVWDAGRGFVAYAYPTYEGGARKADVPEAEEPAIGAAVAQVSSARPVLTDVRRGQREATVITACALPVGQVAWTLARVPVGQALVLQRLGLAAAVALGLLAVVGAWLLLGLRGWARKLAAIEKALIDRPEAGARLALTGERDLDRLVVAFNASAAKLEGLDADAQRLNADLARAERLGGLGRVAAGMAHEIRNPLGSMRLRVENALAVEGPAALDRRTTALKAVLEQVARLDGLVGGLLALTRPMRPERRPTALAAWLHEAVALRQPTAQAAGVVLQADAEPGRDADIDAPALARALDNLVLNAIQFSPPGGTVTVTLQSDAAHWRVCVDDAGPGVDAAVLPRLFEPFATRRAGGTGLGLAAAFETVAGHGGRLRCLPRPDGAPGSRFEMEFPWPAS